MGEERPPPQVTVRDPSRPERTAEVLASGSDDPPRPNPLTPRRLRALLAVLLVAGTAVGVVELRERRAAAAEQRRLDRVVDLAVERRGGSTSYDPGTSQVTLDLQLRVVNRGPRDLLVERGALGGYRLVQQMVEVGAGDTAPLLLRKRLTCSPTTPPPEEPLTALELALRTPAGPRQVTLPVEVGGDDGARACGFLELEESVDITVLGAQRTPAGVELAVDLASRSVREVALAAVDPGPGLSVQVGVLDQGEALLPVALPRRGGQDAGRGLTFELLLNVTDCRVAQTARPQLAFRFTDDVGRVSQPLIGYEPAFLSSLLADSCSG